MRLFKLAFTRRWFGYLGAAIVFAIACVLLSNWQVDRLNEAHTANLVIEHNFNGTPAPLADVLPKLTSYGSSLEWKQVSMSGTYLLHDELLVRNRPLDGNPGFEILTPLLLPDGRVFVVDRGYVPTGNTQDRPSSIPQPASTHVSVVVRLQPTEPVDGTGTPPAGEIGTIHLPTVAKLVGRPTFTRAYGLMVSETPAAAVTPMPQPEPSLDEGLHISYAIQWILFGIMGFFGLGYAIRTEYRARNADDPEEKARAAERLERKLAKPKSDSEVEDELIDARGR
jgi:cytochrome oxidase assembly protein ShyY1